MSSRKSPIRHKAYNVRLHLVVHEKVVTLSSTGLRVTPELNWLEVASVLKFLFKSRYFIFWSIGDLCNYAINKFGVNTGFLKSIYGSEVSNLHRFGKTRMGTAMRCSIQVPIDMRTEGLHPQLQCFMFTMADQQLAYQLCQTGFNEQWTVQKFIEERKMHYPEAATSILGGLIKS